MKRASPEAESRKPRSLVRITGLDDRETDECFETEFTARTNPHRGYITIIEGCDKFCSYCVVPLHARQRAQPDVGFGAGRGAPDGRSRLHGNSTARAEREFVQGSGREAERKKTFAELLAAVGEIPGIRRVRFTTSHPRDFGRDIVDAIDAVPTLCDHVHLPVQSGSTRMLDAMQRLYNREQYLERIAWMKAAKREISITTDMIVGFPGETESDFAETLSLLDEVGFDAVFAFKYSPRPNTPSIKTGRCHPRRRKVPPPRSADGEAARNSNHSLQEIHRHNL